METTFDVLVLGSGPGGYVAAIRAAQLGLKVAVVEREALGGICLNWGCIPTKALLKSAEVYDYMTHAVDYGLSAQGTGVDFPAVVKRSRGVADTMSSGIKILFKKNKITAIMGTGKLLPGRQIEVTDADGKATVHSAQHIIIATGGRARELPGIAIDGQRVIGYRQAMVLPQQPKKLLVMGSGAIGTEFAYFYAALGTEVTIVEYAPRIVPLEDEEVSKMLTRQFGSKGIKVMTGAKITAVTHTATGVSATIETAKGTETLEADVLLSAVGVVANVENIGLEHVGIATANGKITVDDLYRTNVPGYYAIGDCVPGPALAHKASAEGIICAEAIAGHHPQTLDYGNIPSCVYCQPEIASVGMTEKAARDAGYDLKVGKFPFTASGKATAMGKKDGFVKLVFDAKYGELLGAHMIGPNVTEMIAEIVVARKLETTGHEIIKSVHPHPTLSEAVMEAAAAAYGEVIHL